ncbi:hypothetical protein COCNU_05G005190 [Cocos nucifera]|uniref:Uncharacterized protein n=1 Tax=Cocos nucifera TaxID=13894 RepID=A0A8K0I9P6_COCNU|nr:hypothetical protein COCNU_05G005190 [Cocos nucifera]
MRYRTKAEMFKVAKDRASKEAKEASTRVEAIEKRAQDAETALMKSIKENSHLLGVNEALTLEMEVLKVRLVKAKVFEKEARAALKDIEERMAMLQSDMEAQIEITAVRTVEKFWASKEFEGDKDRFAVDAYDEERCSIRSEVASHYPGLNLDFLDEDLKATNIDVVGAQSNPKDVS